MLHYLLQFHLFVSRLTIDLTGINFDYVKKKPKQEPFMNNTCNFN